MNATATQMPQMPMGSPRLDGANHAEMAGMPATASSPQLMPSSALDTMNRGRLLPLKTPMRPPTISKTSAITTVLRMPSFFMMPAAGNANTHPMM